MNDTFQKDKFAINRIPLNALVKKLMTRRGIKFSTKYGQTATIYRLDNPAILKVAETCLKPTDERYSLDAKRDGAHSIAIKIPVRNDAVYLVYYWLGIESLNEQLRSMIRTGFPNPFYHLIVHNGIARPLYESEAQIIIGSVMKNIPPTVYAVIAEPDY